jgi:predicted LPLAT superfamily acyltransferase
MQSVGVRVRDDGMCAYLARIGGAVAGEAVGGAVGVSVEAHVAAGRGELTLGGHVDSRRAVRSLGHGCRSW